MIASETGRTPGQPAALSDYRGTDGAVRRRCMTLLSALQMPGTALDDLLPDGAARCTMELYGRSDTNARIFPDFRVYLFNY